jgi:hypothetical protein
MTPTRPRISRRSLANSRILFVDQLLKQRIIVQRLPHRIDAQQGRSQWSEGEPAEVMGVEKFWESGHGTGCFTGLSFDYREPFLGGRSVVGVITF